jgi:hypothetical protein
MLELVRQSGGFATLLELGLSAQHPAHRTAHDAVICALYGADQAETLIEGGAFNLAIAVLRTKGDSDAVMGVLDTLRVLPDKFDHLAEFLVVEKIFEDCGGWRTIENLRSGGDTKISGNSH